MLPQLPAEGSVSLFFAVLFGTVGFVAFFAFGLVLFSAVMAAVGVFFIESLGLFPRMTLAGNRGKEESGGSGSEKSGQFHPGPDVADRPPMASGIGKNELPMPNIQHRISNRKAGRTSPAIPRVIGVVLSPILTSMFGVGRSMFDVPLLHHPL